MNDFSRKWPHSVCFLWLKAFIAAPPFSSLLTSFSVLLTSLRISQILISGESSLLGFDKIDEDDDSAIATEATGLLFVFQWVCILTHLK
jgi:hypothetical protein